jgi:hypothetical protein
LKIPAGNINTVIPHMDIFPENSRTTLKILAENITTELSKILSVALTCQST